MNYIWGKLSERLGRKAMGLKFLINLGLPGCNDLVLFRYSMGSPFLFVSIKAFVIS
jgi:hypothetical protein